jgi:hypothetical protein
MAQQKVRLVAFAWGHHYVNHLLDFALSAALAPGNLPALAAVFDCTAVIVTEEKLFDYVRTHPTTRKLEQVCPVELVPLDDLISDPWQYGMTVTYALFRGFADLGPAMTETYILFLNADFVLADGCYSRLIDRIRSAERVHLAPSYCAVEEYVRARLRKTRKQNDGILAIPPRDMAALILGHPHNTIRAKTVNQSIFEFEYADQFYWKVDAHTLIGHQMPIALIGMRPERELTDLNMFWDWGIVYEFCPSKQLTVIGDSDNFLIMELRSKGRSMESISFGRSSPKQVARQLKGHMTRYQLDNARYELLLHSRDLPSDLADAQRQLRAYVEEVRRHLSSFPSYRGKHPQWAYHLRHFRWRLERKSIRSRWARISSAIEREQGDLTKERDLIDEYLSNDDREQALRYLESEYENTLQGLHQQLQGSHQELARLDRQLQTRTRFAARFYRRIAGASYAYRVSRRRLRKLIRRVADNRALRILAVCPIHSLLFGILEDIPGLHMHLTFESVADGALRILPQAAPNFDLCLIELTDLEAPGTKEFLDKVAAQIRKPGTLLVHWHDQGVVPLRSVHNQIVQFALDRASYANANYAGSWASACATRALHQMRNTPARRRLVPFARLAALAVLAELRERARKTQVVTIPKHCSSATFHIEIPSRESIALVADPMVTGSAKPALTNARSRTSETEVAAQQTKTRTTVLARLPDKRASGAV